MWWPGLSKQLEELVKNCPECTKSQKQRAQPLIVSSFPDLPCNVIKQARGGGGGGRGSGVRGVRSNPPFGSILACKYIQYHRIELVCKRSSGISESHEVYLRLIRSEDRPSRAAKSDEPSCLVARLVFDLVGVGK